MHLSKKWIVSASIITLGLSGCGMFGSNPVEGKWKVASVSSEHMGMGVGSSMSNAVSDGLDGKTFTFTSDKMIGPSGVVPLKKYVIKHDDVQIYAKLPNGAEPILHGTLSNHDKDLSLNMQLYILHLQKIS